jgi:HAD superfamily hydrolase (TIGR01458 family)
LNYGLSHIRGFLIDLDGTLYVGDKPIEGAVETIEYLRKRNIPIRFTTNTTTRSLASLQQKTRKIGLPVRADEIFGVIRAAQLHLRKRGASSCFLLVSDDPKEDFREFPENNENPDVIIIGDVGKNWDYELMQRLFDMVTRGADIVALHKGKYWQTPEGLKVDMGAFIAGLEYVTDKAATVVGKPSKSFFELAVDDLGMSPGDVAMVGDDIGSDVGGAQNAGMTGILVKTGKYREELVARSDIRPDRVIDSIKDLPALI